MRTAAIERKTKETDISLSLSLDGGELHVDGRIEAVNYEEQPVHRGGFFSRLLG